MSRDHLTVEEMAGYGRRALAPNELLAASDHLVECAECRERLDREQPPLAGAGEGSCSYEDLVAYLENDLDPLQRREISGLLARSPRARAELDDLVRFRAEMNRWPARDLGDEDDEKVIAFPALLRWVLPLAAALAVAGAALWWNTRSSPDSILVLNDGGQRIEVRANGRVPALANLSDAQQRDISAAVRRGALDVPTQIAALAGHREALAGEASAPDPFRVQNPVATAVRDGRPNFEWTPLPGATSYRITIVDSTNGTAVTTAEMSGARPSWTPNESLTAGRTYQWQIEALRGTEVIERAPKPPQPEARFQVLTAAARQEVERAEAKAGSSHLAKAVIDAQAGLLGEARQEVSALIEQNPDLPTLRRWFAQLEQKPAAR